MQQIIVRYENLNEVEKSEVFNIIDMFTDFSIKAWKEGILALEDDVNKLSNKDFPKNAIYMKKVLSFIIDGLDGDVAQYIAETYINSSADNDFEKMCFCMILEGTMAIQRGENPHIIAVRLSAYTGLRASSSFIEKEYAKIDTSGFYEKYENETSGAENN